MIRHLFRLGVIVLVSFSVCYTCAAGDLGIKDPKTSFSRNVAPSANLSPIDAPTIALKNIVPLYSEPKMRGEGIWVKQDMSGGHDQAALIYRTFYRPSVRFPTAIVYMMVINMHNVSAKIVSWFLLNHTKEIPLPALKSQFNPNLCASPMHFGQPGTRGQVE